MNRLFLFVLFCVINHTRPPLTFYFTVQIIFHCIFHHGRIKERKAVSAGALQVWLYSYGVKAPQHQVACHALWIYHDDITRRVFCSCFHRFITSYVFVCLPGGSAPSGMGLGYQFMLYSSSLQIKKACQFKPPVPLLQHNQSPSTKERLSLQSMYIQFKSTSSSS